MKKWTRIRKPTEAESERYQNKYTRGGNNECWTWTAARSPHGHGVFHWDGRNWPAHRLALAWVERRCSVSLHALHDCGNAPCVNPAHVYWGTQKQNSADRKRHGTYFCGETHPNAILTNKLVTEVWNSYHLTDERIEDIVSRTGVKHGSVMAILSRSVWRHITDSLTPKKPRPFRGEFGSRHWRSWLTEDDVRSLRKRYDAGEKFSALAAEIGMAKAACWRICTRRAWKHLDC
jgi:hypothetical protein